MAKTNRYGELDELIALRAVDNREAEIDARDQDRGEAERWRHRLQPDIAKRSTNARGCDHGTRTLRNLQAMRFCAAGARWRLRS
jgi:hypothetical protein